jgi:hypothetical protein
VVQYRDKDAGVGVPEREEEDQMRVKIKVCASLKPTEMQMQTLGASISGTLFLEVDDTFFPAQGWRDMTVHVLGTWLQLAMSVVHSTAEVMHSFMDGPYVFSLTYDRATLLAKLGLYEMVGGKPQEYVVDFRRYLASLRGATKIVLHEADTLGLRNRRELEDLQGWLKQFIQFENSITRDNRSRI